MKKAKFKAVQLKLVKLLSACAFAFTVVDVNALGCIALFHQPKLPPSADKLKIK